MNTGITIRNSESCKQHAVIGVFARRHSDPNIYAITSRMLFGAGKILESDSSLVLGVVVQSGIDLKKVKEISSLELVGYFKVNSVGRGASRGSSKNSAAFNSRRIKSIGTKPIAVSNEIRITNKVFIYDRSERYIGGTIRGINSSFKMPNGKEGEYVTVRGSVRVKLQKELGDITSQGPFAGRHVLDEDGKFIGIVIACTSKNIFFSPIYEWVKTQGFELTFNPNVLGRNHLTSLDILTNIDRKHSDVVSLLKETRINFSTYFTNLARTCGLVAMEQVQDDTVRVLIRQYSLETIVASFFKFEINVDSDGSVPNENWLYRSIVDRQQLAIPSANGKVIIVKGKHIAVPVVMLEQKSVSTEKNMDADYLLGRNQISPIQLADDV